MKATSLRLRLLAGAAMAIFLALALAWAGISWLFHQYAERREAAELSKLGEQVIASLTLDPQGKLIADALSSDPRFLAIAGGYYWQVISKAGSVQSQSLWDQSLPPTPARADQWDHATAQGPFGKQLMVVSRQIRLDARPLDIIVRVGSDDSEMQNALAEFDRVLAMSLGLLWLVLSIAAYVQVSLGLRPLDRLRRDMDRLRRSPHARLPDHHPYEILPLTEAINAMASAREGDLARARRRAADLAHGLKTPLAVVAAQSRRAREAGAHMAADSIDRAVEAVAAALEAELARSRAAAARGAGGQSVPLTIAEGVIAVIERTEHGENLAFSVDIPADLRLPVDPSDLAEMLGALLENAARHARRQVRITGMQTDQHVSLRIEDDGPGMDDDALARAAQRGVRLDESGSGHGLGLSIVRDLAEATEGEFHMERAKIGGLAANLLWPIPADHPPKRC